MARIVAFDVGEQRIGVAVSDPTETLASPAGVLRSPGIGRAAVAAAAAEIARLAAEPDGLGAVVVGLPRRLDGSPGALTARIEAFAGALRERIGMPVMLQDERLSSQEAEHRLAIREKSWRARKARLDAAAAAVILQDYLDGSEKARGTEQE